ncbi:MAG: hypothetical protein FWF84_04325 [Kiritimatiellaeota bacterium]|nr:hypothetical protein [Kiritimatiellota bacterium]
MKVARLLTGTVLGWVASGGYALAMTGGDITTFTLTEYLGAAWSNECVTYSVDEATAAHLRDGAVCQGDDGAEAPWQLSADGGGVRFIASLPAFGQRTYRFTSGAPSVKTALTVAETQAYLEIANALTGVRISTSLKDGDGPILAWRLSDGTWAGGSAFAPTRKVETYRAFIVENGPVLARVEAVASFEGGGSWTVTAELQEGEPSFKIRESFECVPSAGTFTLRFDEGLDPEWMLFRSAGQFEVRAARTGLGQIMTLPLSHTPERDPSLRFLLQPWVWWQGSLARGHFFTLMNTAKNTAVTMITSDTRAWVDPAIPAEERAESATWLRRSENGALTLDFQVKRGEREYVMSVLSSDAILADAWDISAIEIPPPDDSGGVADLMPKDASWERLYRAPLSEAVALRISHYPLNRLKELILEWPEADAGSVRPRMLVAPEDIARWRENTAEYFAGRRLNIPYNVYHLDSILPAYIATGDKELGDILYAEIPKIVQGYVNWFLKLAGDNICLGVAPHHRSVIVATTYAVDVWLGLPQVTPEDRRSLKGQLAFLAYILASEDYFSPERGFGGGFINMRTIVAMNQLALGSVLADHPLTRKWTDMGFDFIQTAVIDTWQEDGMYSGRSVEAPHYGIGSFDPALAAMRMRDRLGFPHDMHTAKVKDAGAWFAKICTPRDPRFSHWRHLSPIGNTYLFERTGIFGIMAHLYRDADPKFSAEMQWIDNEQGNFLAPGTGGFGPAFAGSRELLRDRTLPAQVPDWKSEWFRHNGAVLRSKLATEDETFLYLIAGVGARSQNHWDMDQGGITLWNRSVPIADDFGYYGCAPEEDNSMLTSRAATGIMEIEAFSETPTHDYVRGKKGAWTREIVLVKHDATTPDYFVIRDTMAEPAEATWRMWLTPLPEPIDFDRPAVGIETVTFDTLSLDEPDAPDDKNTKGYGLILLPEGAAMMVGYDDRTTWIHFLQKPADATFSIEPKTRTCPGEDATGNYSGGAPHTRMGLIVHSPAFDTFLTVIRTTKDGEPLGSSSISSDGTITVGNDTLRFTPDGVSVHP